MRCQEISIHTHEHTLNDSSCLVTFSMSPVTPKISGEAMTPSDTGEQEKMEGAAVVDELKKVAQDVQTIRQRMEDHLRPTQDKNDWKMIANVIDRFVFLLYILFMFVGYTTISVIWARS